MKKDWHDIPNWALALVAGAIFLIYVALAMGSL